jgi:general secretion pathway protein J
MTAAGGNKAAQAGFTLIETLIAMVLMGLIISALASVTAQWLPNWDRGYASIQRSESISIALDRISADIGASEFVTPSRQAKTVLFDGSELSITFAREAFGPNARPGLDLVRINEVADRDGLVLTRSRAPWGPGAEAAPNFADPVVLLRAPYRVSFSYAGTDRAWQNSWHDAKTLPAAVLLTVRDATTGRTLPISRVAVIHISASADSVCAQAEGGCADKQAAGPGGAAGNTAAGNAPASQAGK